jgi:sucrose phosphorylase
VQFLADQAVAHGGRVSYKTNPDGSQSPYELNCVYFNLLSSEDEPLVQRVSKMILAHAILLTMPGVPGIYFHSLMGSQNDQDGVQQTGQNRSINRKKLVKDDLDTELIDAGSLRHEIFGRLKSLIQLRTAEPCFHPNAGATVDKIGEAGFVMRRTWKGRELVGIFNLSDSSIEIPSHFQNETAPINDVSGNQLKPFGFAWLVSVE